MLRRQCLHQRPLQEFRLPGQAPLQGLLQGAQVRRALLCHRSHDCALALLQQGALAAGMRCEDALEARLDRLHQPFQAVGHLGSAARHLKPRDEHLLVQVVPWGVHAKKKIVVMSLQGASLLKCTEYIRIPVP